MSTTPVIEIQNLHRRYGRLDAVNGLNLRVQPGRSADAHDLDAPGK